ncbi:MAG TPA: GldG family protein, partial [bacterium]|nr:GldG family protein [bacterium]
FRAQALETVRSRRTRQGANAAVFSVAVVAIAVLIQALLAGTNVSADVTKNKTFTLADETVKTVKGLGGKVQVLAFFGEENRAQFEDLLKRVRQINPAQFDFQFVDPNKNPLMAQEYGVRTLGTSVVVAGEQKETFNGIREEDLLNALLKVGSGAKKQVYFLSGHQERSPDDSQAYGASGLKQGLESSSFVVRPLNLATEPGGQVPADADALVIAGPMTDPLPAELDALTKYLARGGRIFTAVDPRAPVPAYKAWLAKAGVVLGDNVVVDMLNRLYGASPLAPIVQSFDPGHPATKDLLDQHGQGMFPQTRTVSLAAKLPDGANGVTMARSLPTAFAWAGKGDKVATRPGPGDTKGPVSLMVSVELPLKDFGGDASDVEKRARLVVLGSSSVLANMGVGAYNNQDLVVNSLRWLAGDEKRIALAPKPTENSPLLLDHTRMGLMSWAMVLMVLGALGMSVGVGMRRKREA